MMTTIGLSFPLNMKVNPKLCMYIVIVNIILTNIGVWGVGDVGGGAVHSCKVMFDEVDLHVIEVS